MTADDVTHLFRSTEKCKPGTRGNHLNVLSHKVLVESLNSVLAGNPSPDHFSFAESLSPSPTQEVSPEYSGLELEQRYMEALSTLEQSKKTGKIKSSALLMLQQYVKPGAAISVNDVQGMLQSIREAELMYLNGRETLTIHAQCRNFVRGFLCGRGYDEYFF